jgi:hypothetical protein
VDGGLFNCDYPARASVGKRSGVSAAGSSHQDKEHEQLATEFMRAAPLAPLPIDHWLPSLRLSQSYK